MRVFFELSYNGAPFNGWQVQPDAPSVQAALEAALATLYRTPVPVVGAGRTDTGVNALSTVAHADLPHERIPLYRLKYSLNGLLRGSIHIRRIRPVLPGAHARFDALSRTYYYYIAQEKDPFMGAWVLEMRRLPGVELMNRGAEYLLGTQDFTSLSKTHTDTKTNICRVSYARWEVLCAGNVLRFTITADRFLRNMVRAAVGTLIEVGRGKIPPEAVREILLAKDRCRAGSSVPGEALFLAQVTYPPELYLPDPPEP